MKIREVSRDSWSGFEEGSVQPTGDDISLKFVAVGLMCKLRWAERVVAFLAKKGPCYETVG